MLSKVLAVLMVSFPLTMATAGGWASYTNTDAFRQIVIKGDSVWGATSGGVVAYNGVSGEVVALTNTDGLGGININCAELDTAGNLWFGTNDGWLSRITADGEIRNFPFRDSTGLFGRAVALYDLDTDRDRLWVASDLGVSKFLPYRTEIKETARQLGSIPREENVVCVKVIGNSLWAGTARGVAFIDKDNPVIENYANWHSFMIGEHGLGNADIRTIVAYSDTVLVGTAGGVYRFLLAPDTSWAAMGLTGLTVFKLADISGTLIAATSVGLYQYTSSGWISYYSSGLPSRLANDLAVDQRGKLWAASPTSGLGGLEDTLWTMNRIPGPASNIVRRMAIDSSGGIWMAHDSKGLSRLYDGQWQLFKATTIDLVPSGPIPNILDNEQVTISAASNGDIWISSFGGGLYRYQLESQSWYRWNQDNSPMYGVPGNHYYWAATGVAADDQGRIWVTSFGSDSSLMMGVFAPYSPDSTWQTFRGDEIGLGPDITAQTFLFDGTVVWVGRESGLDRLDHAGTPFDRSDDTWDINIIRENVLDMEIDQGGTLWLATASGLYFAPPSADTAFGFEIPPSITGSANAIEMDGAGNLWVGTVAGLGVLKPNIEQPSLSIWESIYITANSPLLNNKVNGLVIDVASGTIYIGTDGGLSVFNSGILPPTSDLSDMDAFPNPAVISDGVEQIEFTRVPSSGTLTIFTSSGDEVAQIDLSQGSTWNLRNSSGKRVAGGVYIFYVKSGEASGTGKFAIIK